MRWSWRQPAKASKGYLVCLRLQVRQLLHHTYKGRARAVRGRMEQDHAHEVILCHGSDEDINQGSVLAHHELQVVQGQSRQLIVAGTLLQG